MTIQKALRSILKYGKKSYYYDIYLNEHRKRTEILLYSGIKFENNKIFYVNEYVYDIKDWKKNPKYLDITLEFNLLCEKHSLDESIEIIKETHQKGRYNSIKVENNIPNLIHVGEYSHPKYEQILKKRNLKIYDN